MHRLLAGSTVAHLLETLRTFPILPGSRFFTYSIKTGSSPFATEQLLAARNPWECVLSGPTLLVLFQELGR